MEKFVTLLIPALVALVLVRLLLPVLVPVYGSRDLRGHISPSTP